MLKTMSTSLIVSRQKITSQQQRPPITIWSRAKPGVAQSVSLEPRYQQEVKRFNGILTVNGQSYKRNSPFCKTLEHPQTVKILQAKKPSRYLQGWVDKDEGSNDALDVDIPRSQSLQETPKVP